MFLPVKKQKNTYYRILISLLFLGIILVISLSVVISLSSEHQNIKIIVESDKKVLEQIAYSTNYVDDTAKIFSLALFTNSSINKLFQQNRLELLDAVHVMNELRSQVNITAIVHSVYVYNKNAEWVYSTTRNLSQSLDDFFDPDMKKIIKNNDFTGRLRAIPRIIPASGGLLAGADLNVFTYILPLYPYSKSSFPSGLIVNIDAEYLMELIKQLQSEDSSKIIVINNENQIIANSDKKKFLTPLPDMYKEMVEQLELKNSGRFKINNEDMLVTMVKSDKSHWRFIKISDYKEVIKPVIRQRILLIIIGLSFISVVIILSLLFSNNLYKPIRELVKHVQDKGDLTALNELNKGELDYIASSFSNVLEKVADLNSFRNSNVKALRSQFFKDILSGKIDDHEEIENKMSTLDCSMSPNSYFRILRIHIDHKNGFKDNQTGDSVNTFLQNVLSIVSGLYLDPKYCEIISMDNKNALIIISTPEFIEREQVLEIHKETLKEIHKIFNCHVSTAISSGAKCIYTLPEQYLETLELIEYRLILGPSSMISIDDIEDLIDESKPFPVKMEKQLIVHLKEGKEDICNQNLLEISEILINYSYENIRLGYMRLASSIFDYLNSLESFSSESFPYRFTGFSKELNECPFINDIKLLFKNLFKSICLFQAQNFNNRSQKHIIKVKMIVEKEYRDPGLNLSMVAGTLNMSPVYLGRVFKQLTFQSFNNYLNLYRLEKASKMLSETDLTIESISQDVGITNTRFFFTKFKTEYGVTPTHFRKNK